MTLRPLIVALALIASVAVVGSDLGAASARGERPDGVERPELDRALADALADVETPGLSAAVIFANGSIWTGATGLADPATDRPVKTSTPFAVASVTKTFVAALVLQLADKGALGLDEPVSRWLPQLRDADRITLRQLLGHTSGLADGPPPREPTYPWTPEEALADPGPMACEPGTCFRYGDANYVAAGAVIEAVTGEPLPDVLNERILEPLGLRRTWLQGFEEPRGRVAIHVVNGDDDASGNEPSTEFVTRVGAAGALATTASELAIWGDALFNGRVLDPSSFAQMTDFDATAALSCPTADRCTGFGSYGLGMETSLSRGWTTWRHSGSAGALLAHFPHQQVTVAVLTNRGFGEVPGPQRAFDALVAAIPELDAGTDLFTIDRDGAQRKRLTRSAGIESVPAFSPDSTQIAFATDRSGDGEIVTRRLAGGRQTALTANDGALDARPAWSPDGKQLAFESDRDGNREIYVMDADGKNETRLTDEAGEDAGATWSPDGTRIAYHHRDDSTLELRAMNTDGSGSHTILFQTPSGPLAGYPAWSPDGQRLAFAGGDDGDLDIQLVNVDGTGLTTVTIDHVPESAPAWAPDGTLAFVRLGDVYVLTPGSDGPRRVTSTPAEEFFPAWSPDGQSLVYAATSGKPRT